jgi:hypothetical protein
MISDVHGRTLFMENGADIQLSELVEMVEIEVKSE